MSTPYEEMSQVELIQELRKRDSLLLEYSGLICSVKRVHASISADLKKIADIQLAPSSWKWPGEDHE